LYIPHGTHNTSYMYTVRRLYIQIVQLRMAIEKKITIYYIQLHIIYQYQG